MHSVAARGIALPEGEREGRFEDIDQTGRMRLRLDGGAIETVTAGDVLPAPAGADT